jgi:hypothetical protein
MFKSIVFGALILVVANQNFATGFSLNPGSRILCAGRFSSPHAAVRKSAQGFLGSISADIRDEPNHHLSRRDILTKILFISTAGLISRDSAQAFGAGQREIGEITASGIISKIRSK